MARTFNVYNGDTLIKSGLSPLELQQLEPDTTYDLKISASEFMSESEKVAVPRFNTLPINHLRKIVASDFTTVNGATLTDDGETLKITSDGTGRMQMVTPTARNNVITTPLVQGKTYKLVADIKVEEGYSGTPIPLNSFKIILSGNTTEANRLILTANPIEISTTEYKKMSGIATISGDISKVNNYYLIIQSDNSAERFTGTLRIKNIQVNEVKE